MSRSIRKWHDLPQELIELILRNLFYLDQIRFRAVCKGWRSMYGVPSIYLLPMFMVWHKDPFTPSKIFDPIYKKTFSIHPNCDILIKDETMDICASNFGWLLFCKQYKTKYAHSVAATSFFFFVNPFTGETIDLPPLFNIDFGIATFSSPPTSNNCIVLNYYPIPNNNDRFSVISTICVGDKAWNSTKCCSPVDYHATNNVVLLDKLFYFVSCIGNLATFNLAERTWNVLNVPLKWSLYCTHLVKSGEELLLVCSGSNNVFKFDFTKMSWIHMASLKGATLFLGITSFSALPSQATGKMGDRLYYANVPPLFSSYRFEFYSMKSGRMFSGVASYGDVTRECPKSTHLCKKLWIGPPSVS